MSTPHISCLTLLYISKWVHSTYHVQRCCTYKHEHTARITGLFRCRVFVRCCSANNSCKQQYYWCCNMSRGCFAFESCKAVPAHVLPLPIASIYQQGLGLASLSGRPQTRTLANTKHYAPHIVSRRFRHWQINHSNGPNDFTADAYTWIMLYFILNRRYLCMLTVRAPRTAGRGARRACTLHCQKQFYRLLVRPGYIDDGR